MDGKMKKKPFRNRSYKHFDRPLPETWVIKVSDPEFVAKHPFSPLIYYKKQVPHYKYCGKARKGIMNKKERDIMYASHRDAGILTHYAEKLVEKLDNHYSAESLSDKVIAYRRLGKTNYDFAAEAWAFAKKHSPVKILAFDVSGFFDNLDHSLLKIRLKRILGVSELPADWFQIFRYTTKFCFVKREDLESNATFRERLKKKGPYQVASVSELKRTGISFNQNCKRKGIPQGTPISAVLSNLYMIDFDAAVLGYCDSIRAFYRRYSDDILIICEVRYAKRIERKIKHLIKKEKLRLNKKKTERTLFDVNDTYTREGGLAFFFKSLITRLIHGTYKPERRVAQYLGFYFEKNGVSIRSSSLSRQWRKLRVAIKRTWKKGLEEMKAGRVKKVWTKKLRRRFTPGKSRNFFSYADRSTKAFGEDQKIKKQIRKFRRTAEKEIQKLADLKPPR